MEDKKTSSSQTGDTSTQQPSGQDNAKPPTATPAVVEHHTSIGNWCCCAPCYWLRTNNSVHKASLTVATLLVTSLLVASPVLFLISAVPSSDVPPKDCRFLPDDSCLFAADGNSAAVAAILGPECSDPQCIAAAARVASALDNKADPCSDFQQFSCGKWKSGGGAHSLEDMQRAVDVHLQHLLENASGRFKNLAVFYKSCIEISKKPVNLTPSKYFCKRK